MLPATDDRRAIIRTRTINAYTLIFVVTLHVAFTAPKEGIAIIVTFSWNNNASRKIGIALCVFVATDSRGAIIRTRPRYCDTRTTSAHCVLRIIASHNRIASIGIGT